VNNVYLLVNIKQVLSSPWLTALTLPKTEGSLSIIVDGIICLDRSINPVFKPWSFWHTHIICYRSSSPCPPMTHSGEPPGCRAMPAWSQHCSRRNHILAQTRNTLLADCHCACRRMVLRRLAGWQPSLTVSDLQHES